MNQVWNITFAEWHEFVEDFLNIKNNRLNKHLQTYPFSTLSQTDKEYISGHAFFENFIENGAFLGSRENLRIIDNVLQKNNGDFRNVTLVNPIQYLVFIVLGGHLSKIIKPSYRYIDSFYAGNFETGQLYYAESYKRFSIKAKELGSVHDHYYKIDFTNFFPNLNLALLFSNIQRMAPEEDPKSLMIYQNMLEFFGSGSFPIVDGNPGLSFIATKCFLSQFDDVIVKALMENLNILKFHIVRYVDDAYIFFSCNDLAVAKNEIQVIVQDAAKLCKLNLNHSKQKFGNGTNISYEVAQNLYDYEVNGVDVKYEQYYNEQNLETLFQDLFALKRDASFNEIEETFINSFKSDFNFTYTEVWNWYLYDHPAYFENMRVKNSFFKLAAKKNYLFRFYAKQFVRMLINTRSSHGIKKFLNDTFVRQRSRKLTGYQGLMVLEYLISTNFHHEDLMGILHDENPCLYEYIDNYCLTNWVIEEEDAAFSQNGESNEFIERSKHDYVLNYQYFMSTFFENKAMILERFAYYKNYFDRKIAFLFAALDIDGSYKKSKESHPISFGFTYRENIVSKELTKLGVESDLIENISKAYELRNQNPVSHASAEVFLDSDLKTTDLVECLGAMNKVIELLYEKLNDAT